MKTYIKLSSIKSLSIPLVVVFLVSLACSNGVSPTDPNIPPVISPYLTVFGTYLGYLKGLPSGQIPTPMIISPSSPANNQGSLSIQGYGPNQTDLQSKSNPQVTLYAVQPIDCKGGLKKVGTLGSAAIGQPGTDTSDSRQWQIPNLTIPTTVHFIAAVMNIDGKEGPFSDILVLNANEVTPTILTPGMFQNVGREFTLSGKTPTGVCLSIYHDDSWITEWFTQSSQTSVQTMDWSFNVTRGTHQGVNFYQVRLKNIQSIPPATVQVYLETPKIIWPLGTTDASGNYVPDPTLGVVMGWSGTNDYYTSEDWGVHQGLDIAGHKIVNKGDCKDIVVEPERTVHAVANGKVFAIDTKGSSSAGKFVAIDHGTWISWYLHFEQILVTNGVPVTAGTPIGIMGTTGRSSGCHLHLQLIWWGDVSTKNEFIKNNPNRVYQPGSASISLNDPTLPVCPGVENLWNINWGVVNLDPSENPMGITFNICSKNHNCSCLGR